MLNNMGEQGGTKLAVLFNHLNSHGSKNYADFLDVASPEESRAFSEWIERASDGEIMGLASFLNKPPTSDSLRLKQAIISFAGLRIEQIRKPNYESVKSAIVNGRTDDVHRLLNDGFDIDSRNGHGEVVLLHAICMGDARLAITRLLIEHGADVNSTVNGRTILEFIRDTAYCDNEKTIALLIQNGATVSTNDGDLIRFRCPKCNKRLKAIRNAAGKKATCNKCGNKMNVPAVAMTGLTTSPQSPTTVPVPAKRLFDVDLEEESDLPWMIEEPVQVSTQRVAPPPIPRKKNASQKPAPRQSRMDIWLSIGFLVALVAVGVGAYWWAGQPSAQHVAVYENFLRTGNELADMHQPITTEAEARQAEPELMAKAQEHIECRKELAKIRQTIGDRQKKNLENQFASRIGDFNQKIVDLVKSNKPIKILVGVSQGGRIVFSEATDWGEYVILPLSNADAKTDVSNPQQTPANATSVESKPPAQSWTTGSFAGRWRAKDFSFDIQPDGRGRAEFDNFSQGTGSFSISQGGKPVRLTADFQIESRDGKPVFSFELTASPGAVSRYEFEILSSARSDELTVKELRGGRIDPNPTVMTRKTATERPVAIDAKKKPHPLTGDASKLQGKWQLQLVKWAESDKTSSIYVTSKSYIVVDGDQMITQNEDGSKTIETKYNFKLDSTKKPAVYERTAIDGKNKGATSTGIYVIEGDTLKMCDQAKGLPADFEITQGKDVKDKYLFVYKRVK